MELMCTKDIVLTSSKEVVWYKLLNYTFKWFTHTHTHRVNNEAEEILSDYISSLLGDEVYSLSRSVKNTTVNQSK